MTRDQVPRKSMILVVDDAIENINIIGHILKDENEVIFALDGEEALDIIKEQLPDIILLDAIMPGMDGYAVCRELKKSPRTEGIPIIFITSLNSPEDETRALEAGAVDFITKPVNRSVVKARVKTHLTLKRQSDMLWVVARTDGLTGISNRRCFDEELDKEWRRCERIKQPIAVILADIDHFKNFNDHYGHQAGDACLVAVARSLSDSIRRPPDIVARYGGEEFVIALPHDSAEGAKTVAQRILDSVRALAIPHHRSSCAPVVTVSVGVAAAIPSRGQTPATLIAAADTCLYRAKETGRNRYIVDEA